MQNLLNTIFRIRAYIAGTEPGRDGEAACSLVTVMFLGFAALQLIADWSLKSVMPLGGAFILSWYLLDTYARHRINKVALLMTLYHFTQLLLDIVHLRYNMNPSALISFVNHARKTIRCYRNILILDDLETNRVMAAN